MADRVNKHPPVKRLPRFKGSTMHAIRWPLHSNSLIVYWPLDGVPINTKLATISQRQTTSSKEKKKRSCPDGGAKRHEKGESTSDPSVASSLTCTLPSHRLTGHRRHANSTSFIDSTTHHNTTTQRHQQYHFSANCFLLAFHAHGRYIPCFSGRPGVSRKRA